MKYYLDTEFNGFGGELISLALVGEDNRELYLAIECKNPKKWVKENVIPVIRAKKAVPQYVTKDEVGAAIELFLRGTRPVIIADWPDDIRYFCEALIRGPGEMVNIKQLEFHVIRVDSYPTELEGAVQHNALWDARALRKVLEDTKQ